MGSPKKVLVLGATGMLGHVLLSFLSEKTFYRVFATVRNPGRHFSLLSPLAGVKIYEGVDAGQFDTVHRVLSALCPDVVINCIGIVKQHPLAEDPIASITVNALFPHLLSKACSEIGSRLIHISSDCVFSGTKGNYTEQYSPDPADLYGRSKFLGEVSCSHCTTLRSSLIGHELESSHGLLEWFLSRKGPVNGYSKAIFSGFPTIEFSRIISDYVIPNTNISGVYHVSAQPISKYELLKLIAERYGKAVAVIPDDSMACDRSLDSTRFQAITGYAAPLWNQLIAQMHDDAITRPYYHGGK